jgi:membrane-associated phospholipid phosphatase
VATSSGGTLGSGVVGSVPAPSVRRDPRRIVSSLLVVGLLTGFAAVTVAVVARGPGPLDADSEIHAWAVGHRTTGTTPAALAVTATGSGAPAYLFAALAGWLGAAGTAVRRASGAVGALAALLVGQGIRLLVANALGRPRPSQQDWLGGAGGPAYPSGHTVTSALVAALICVAAARVVPRGPRRAVRAGAISWAALVGLTRIYLGVHWATDVLAAWLLAAALVTAARVAGGRRFPASRGLPWSTQTSR